MKFCITTLYDDNFSKFAPYSIKTFETFCEYNNCNLEVYNKLFDDNLHPSWNKLLALKECFKKYDLVLWADADSLFTGIKNNFIQFNNFNAESSLMVPYDDNGICLSHILISNCQYNINLIDTLLFLKDVKDDSVFGIGPKWEQNALKALTRHFNIKLQLMHPESSVDCTFNTFPRQFFFFHYPVMTNEYRYNTMKLHYERLYGDIK